MTPPVAGKELGWASVAGPENYQEADLPNLRLTNAWIFFAVSPWYQPPTRFDIWVRYPIVRYLDTEGGCRLTIQ